MKRILKNVLGIVLLAGVSVSIAVGTSMYLMHRKYAADTLGVNPAESGYGFKQPARLVNYDSVAAENIDFTTAAESAIHAVVHIKATIKGRSLGGNRQYIDPFEYFFGFGNRGNQQRPSQARVGYGSGVIISTDGYVITNNHVVEDADEIEVTLNDERTFISKLVGTDATTDIALLKIEGKDFPTIPFGDSDKLKVGEWVLAVGNPFNLTSTVTAGIVSAKGRGVLTGDDRNGIADKIASYIQTDAAVNRGNSGGALVNTKGELVGINTLIYSETGNFAGYSFAIPISIAGKVATDLKQYGTVQRAMLGISIRDVKDLSDEEKGKLKALDGVYVADFTQFSSAKGAGVEVGDVITAVNDIKVKSVSELQERISRFRPGDKVRLAVDRNGANKTFTVELRNMQGNTDVIKGQNDAVELLGAAFKELTDKQKQEHRISYGVEVAAIFNGKLKEAGITKGFIIMTANEQRVSTAGDLEKIVERIMRSNGEDQLLVLKGVSPNGRKRYYAVDLAN
ncbi:MAG: Do family serine endopeptidase [Tannerellaceae bacterium]|jgi:Do/DeqQ family serine protease|nr:Do family serine endopeptidase [Tannerellaceae bacterium]